MFDLEKAVAEWRRRMLAAGIKSPVPLEELEIHLREEMDQLLKTGSNEEEAFNSAVQIIGRPGELKREFGKNERKSMKRNLVILIGILLIAFGPAVFLPALAQHRRDGIWNSGIVIPLAIGAAITLTGFGVAIRGFMRKA